MTLAANVPRTTVELDRPRTVAFTLGAMRRFKEVAGQSVQQLFQRMEESNDPEVLLEELHNLLWSMFIDADREGLTPEQVEEMIHIGIVPEISDAITRLVQPSMPEPKGAAGNSPKPAKKRPAKGKS